MKQAALQRVPRRVGWARLLVVLGVSASVLAGMLLSASGPRAEWAERVETYDDFLVQLYEGEDRRVLAARLRSLRGWFEETVRDRPELEAAYGWGQADELAGLLSAMAAEDAAYREPDDPEALPLGDRLAYHAFHLRDVAAAPMTVPGNSRVLARTLSQATGDGTAAADALRAIGKPAVPLLITMLDDRRPIRSVSRGMNGSYALRYADAAVQILEAIAGQAFLPHQGRGKYFTNAPDAIRQQVVADIDRWWADNRDRPEHLWLRDALAANGVRMGYEGRDAAERLIALEGAASVAFFRERMVAEPELGQCVRYFWRAALADGPAGGDAVLEEVRGLAVGGSFAQRMVATRILLKRGGTIDIPRMLKEIDRVGEVDDWRDFRSEVRSDSSLEAPILILCSVPSPAGFEAACSLLKHNDARIAEEACGALLRHRRPGGMHAAPDRQRALVAGLPAVLARDAVRMYVRLSAARVLVEAEGLEVDLPGVRARLTDEQSERFIADVLAAYRRRVEG